MLEEALELRKQVREDDMYSNTCQHFDMGRASLVPSHLHLLHSESKELNMVEFQALK